MTLLTEVKRPLITESIGVATPYLFIFPLLYVVVRSTSAVQGGQSPGGCESRLH